MRGDRVVWRIPYIRGKFVVPGAFAVGADSITTLRVRFRWQMVPLLVGTVMSPRSLCGRPYRGRTVARAAEEGGRWRRLRRASRSRRHPPRPHRVAVRLGLTITIVPTCRGTPTPRRNACSHTCASGPPVTHRALVVHTWDTCMHHGMLDVSLPGGLGTPAAS